MPGRRGWAMKRAVFPVSVGKVPCPQLLAARNKRRWCVLKCLYFAGPPALNGLQRVSGGYGVQWQVVLSRW